MWVEGEGTGGGSLWSTPRLNRLGGGVERVPRLADVGMDGDIHQGYEGGGAAGPAGLWYVGDVGVTRGWTRVGAPLLTLGLRERWIIGRRCGLGPGGGKGLGPGVDVGLGV
jgi:hypothetical protein